MHRFRISPIPAAARHDGLRGSPIFVPQNILTGDAKAGAAFFNGEGKARRVIRHRQSIRLGTRLTPIDLQQRFLFPDSAAEPRPRAWRGGCESNGFASR